MMTGLFSMLPLAAALGEVGEYKDGLIVLVRWLHALGAVAWIGGSVFFALIVRPAQRVDPDGVGAVVGRFVGPYRELVDVSIITIVVTGLILMFERLTGDEATVAYFTVLHFHPDIAPVAMADLSAEECSDWIIFRWSP